MVRVDVGVTEEFKIELRHHQGSVLSLFLLAEVMIRLEMNL